MYMATLYVHTYVAVQENFLTPNIAMPKTFKYICIYVQYGAQKVLQHVHECS